MGGKEERGKRQERGVNIKARFKGHKHFVPDDNHFPFVFFQCQTGHEAGRFLNSPPNKNQRHIPSMKPPKKKNTYMKDIKCPFTQPGFKRKKRDVLTVGISWEWMRKELRGNKENRAGMRKTGYLGLTRILRERGCGCCYDIDATAVLCLCSCPYSHSFSQTGLSESKFAGDDCPHVKTNPPLPAMWHCRRTNSAHRV